MTLKFRVKIGIDVLMTLGLLFLSGYQFWGDAAHEWVGMHRPESAGSQERWLAAASLYMGHGFL